jgi:hypothetical protein
MRWLVLLVMVLFMGCSSATPSRAEGVDMLIQSAHDAGAQRVAAAWMFLRQAEQSRDEAGRLREAGDAKGALRLTAHAEREAAFALQLTKEADPTERVRMVSEKMQWLKDTAQPLPAASHSR